MGVLESQRRQEKTFYPNKMSSQADCEMGGCCETKERGRQEEMCYGAVVTGKC